MAEWAIEVLHGGFPAFRWQEQHDSALIEAALTNGAVDGAWHADRWASCSKSASTMRNGGKRSATCRPCARPWTACPIPSTACSSTAAGVAEQGTASRASPGRRRARAPSHCPSPAPCRIWTSPAFHHRIWCTPGGQEGQDPDPPGMAWRSGPRHPGGRGRTAPRLHLIEASIPAMPSRGQRQIRTLRGHAQVACRRPTRSNSRPSCATALLGPLRPVQATTPAGNPPANWITGCPTARMWSG